MKKVKKAPPKKVVKKITQKSSDVALKNKIIEALKKVYDPEIPVNIYDIGLIYEIAIDSQKNVVITMTLTAPNCPAAETLPGEAEAAARSVKGVKSAFANITFDPPWTQDMMSESAKLEMGFM